MKIIILFHLIFFTSIQLLTAQFSFKNLEVANSRIRPATSFTVLTLSSATAASAVALTEQTSAQAQSCFKVGSSCTVLPVTLLEFTATRTSIETALLKWQTTGETNFRGYIVERSLNPAADFTERGFVAPKNNGSAKTDYQFIDPNNLTVLSYYRLRMLDLDGSFTYSEVRVVQAVKETTSLLISPNPAFNILNIRITMIEQQDATVFLYDAAGRLIRQWKKIFTSGTNLLSENISWLTSGSYYVVVKSPTTTDMTCKFFKN